MSHDRPLLGILLMLGFCILAPLGDAVAKLIGDSIPLAQVVAIRFAIQALLLWPLVLWTGAAWRLTPHLMALTLLRTVLHITGIAAMFTALIYLPLADAVAIVFVMPFFMLLLGRYVLQEHVGKRRLWACVVGFAGTLLIVQPSFATVGWPALLPLFVAANFAVFMLVTRKIAKATDPIGLQAVSGVLAVVLMVPLLLAGVAFEIDPLKTIDLNGSDWSWLLALGVLGTLAHLLMTWALRFAPSATLAPMQYLEIPFATLLGRLLFGELPNTLAGFGILIATGAGLYVIQRERAIAQLSVLPAPLPNTAKAYAAE